MANPTDATEDDWIKDAFTSIGSQHANTLK